MNCRAKATDRLEVGEAGIEEGFLVVLFMTFFVPVDVTTLYPKWSNFSEEWLNLIF
jgi:hypothetical protein